MEPRTEPASGRSHDDLIRLAGALADGAPIDWDAESDAHPEVEGRLNGMRAVESIARLYRFSAGGTRSVDADRPGQEMLTSWGHLKILQKIGEGAYGEVHLAHDPRLDTEVALKLLRRDRALHDKERFIQEARRLAQVRHANVVTVHGADEHDGRVGLWTDLLRGRTLEERLEEHGTLGWTEAAMIGVELCGALAAIHGAGLVHGDVKTTNVMRVDGDGHHVLMDFGSVREASPCGEFETRLYGTPLAMAPEVLLRNDPPTRAGDIYGLGVLLYRIVSGSFPVEANSIKNLALKHERGEAVPLRDRRADLPARFVQVVERALEREPERRFASVGEMERALLATLDPERKIPGGDDTKRPEPPPPHSVRRFLAIAASVAVIAAAAWVIHWWLPRTPEASLFRMHAGVENPLDPDRGVRLQPGDQLGLKFKSRDPLHVYVFNEAESNLGEINTLFPVPGLDQANPLPGGKRHLLPGRYAGVPVFWDVDSLGGKERILIVASRGSRADLERRIQDEFGEALVTNDDEADIDPDKEEDLRSIKIHLPPPVPGQSELDRIVSSLDEPSDELWWRVFELECSLQDIEKPQGQPSSPGAPDANGEGPPSPVQSGGP